MSASGAILTHDGTSVVTTVGSDDHPTLRQLIHLSESGPMEGWPTGVHRVITGQPFPTNMTWWTDNTLATKILELNITRNASQNPTVEQWKMYAADGVTVLATITDTIAYSGGYEVSRTRAIA